MCIRDRPSISGFSGTLLVTATASSGTFVKVTSITNLKQAKDYCGHTGNADAEPTGCDDDNREIIGLRGTQADLNAALATLSFKGDGATGSPTVVLSVTPDGTNRDPDTGHYYQVVSSSNNITWAAARTAAKSDAKILYGLRGYLTNITTSGENAFITAKIGANAWIGATDVGTEKIWKLDTVNIRDYATDKHKTVDDTPFGGGSGMLLKADILAKSLDQNKNEGEKIIYLSPKGKKFDQLYAQELSKEKSVSFICGHFEGVDERVLSTRNIEEVSIGDYVLSGGETAAFVVIDSILRLLPGVLGNENSKMDESFENGLLEYPQYTKPQIWEEKAVPEVLLSGDHNKIKDWRLSQSEAITRDRRPDLWQKYKKN